MDGRGGLTASILYSMLASETIYAENVTRNDIRGRLS